MKETPDERDTAFERVVTGLDCPMFVVTAAADGHCGGCLVGFASQASINPPRFLVALSRTNHTYRIAADARHLAVHVIGRDHRELAELFGSKTGDEVDKFAKCRTTEGPYGVPILSDSAAWFAGAIVDRFDLGDHEGFLIAPESGEAPDQLPPLVTLNEVAHLDPGHAP